MHTYVLVSSRAPWHRLLDRGLSCEKAKGNVPVLRVHIIAFQWYFLGNEVLCFFSFPSVSACHVLLIICTCLCPTFLCAYRINSSCSLLYLRVFVHTFVHCTVPCVSSACHTTGLAWVPLYDYTTLHFCRLVQCITVSYWASVGPVPLVFYCASVFTSLVPCLYLLCVCNLCSFTIGSPHTVPVYRC